MAGDARQAAEKLRTELSAPSLVEYPRNRQGEVLAIIESALRRFGASATEEAALRTKMLDNIARQRDVAEAERDRALDDLKDYDNLKNRYVKLVEAHGELKKQRNRPLEFIRNNVRCIFTKQPTAPCTNVECARCALLREAGEKT